MKVVTVCFALSLPALFAGCSKAHSSAPDAPDFAGVWDVTFDDSLEVLLRLGESTLRSRVGEAGGALVFRDAATELAFELDCAAFDLVCPTEVLARELSLQRPPGQLDEASVQLSRSLAGLGKGRCVAQPGSFLTAEVLSSGGVSSARVEAVALTSGRATIVVEADCVAPAAGLPKGTPVLLTAGFTAAKR